MESEILSAGFLSALLAIVLIDLVLAGDNALVIGLVARNLPKHLQRRVVLWGTFGAIAARALMAVAVVYILNLPGFMIAGGVALIWIARKLVTPEPSGPDAAKLGAVGAAPVASLAGAIRTIVVADAVMGIDNVLAVGGAAQGSILLLVLGLAISVPIVVWGSHLVIKLVDRFPSVILLGGGVLAWTGYSMVVRDPSIAPWFERHEAAKVALIVLFFAVSLGPWHAPRLPEKVRPLLVLLPGIAVWFLGIETLGGHWGVPIDYLGTAAGPGMELQALRWIGWLPFAAGYVWFLDRVRRARPIPPSRRLAAPS